MTGLNHTLAGALIAIVAPAPFQPLIALISHFVLDSLPHFGNHTRLVPYNTAFIRMLIVDGALSLVALIVAIFLFPDQWLIILICVAASIFPDVFWVIESKSPKWLNAYYVFHTKIQWGERPNGWIYELVFAFFAIATFVLLSR